MMRVSAIRILPVPPGNGGVVPPWLQDPIRIVLPVEPSDDAELPVVPVREEVCDD